MAEVILRIFGIPFPLAIFVAFVYTAAADKEMSLGLFLTIYLITAIVVNGGWLIWDGDMNWFD